MLSRILLAIALILTALASGAHERGTREVGEAICFLSNGVLSELRINGESVLEDLPEQNGIFVLYFDGIRLREIRMESVTSDLKDGNFRATGPNGFPRLEFSMGQRSGGALELRLMRIEGLPRTRDVSVMFRAHVEKALNVAAHGKAEAMAEKGRVSVVWPNCGEGAGDEWGGALIGN